MSLVIGVFENRAKTVPVTFSSESLDIRHRHPDLMGQGVTTTVVTVCLARGFKAPERRVPFQPQFRGEAGRSEVNTSFGDRDQDFAEG